MKKSLLLILAFLLVCSNAIANYDSCKSACARAFEDCIARQKNKSPEQCAGIANLCLYDCKAKYGR